MKETFSDGISEQRGVAERAGETSPSHGDVWRTMGNIYILTGGKKLKRQHGNAVLKAGRVGWV